MPTTSSNMNLPIPTVGVDSGPDWATLIDSCFTLVDQHDHTSGSGVPVTPGGLNINSDLSIGGNNLTSIRSVRMSSNAAVLALGTDLDCIYVVGVDLYYNDGNGNNVRITQSGGVAGSPGSISSLVAPASASYSSGSGKFIWQQAANTSADMDFGSAIMRNDTASSNALTLQPPAAMGSNYSITLPSLPASQKFMTLDASGVMSAPWAVDNSTLEVSSNTVRVKDLGITPQKRSALGQQESGSITFTGVSSASYVGVTGAELTITTTGKPVWVCLQPDGDIDVGAYISGVTVTETIASVDLAIALDGTRIGVFHFENVVGTNGEIKLPPGCVGMLAAPSAGSHTFNLLGRIPTGDHFTISKCILVAYPLG